MKARIVLFLGLVGLLPAGAHAFGPRDLSLPLARPGRNFLLLDAEQRALPGTEARVRVQLRGGGPVRLAVFRLHDPAAWIAQAGNPDGLVVADTPAGRAAEALVAADSATPRAGEGMTLVRVQNAALTAAPARRTGPNEAEAYDGNDADEGTVETRWVRAGRWADTRVSLGTLPAGLYLVRAHVGAYAANTLLAVSDLTLLVRRGDRNDTAVVADGEGRPQAGVPVQVWDHGRLTAVRVSDARGEVRFVGSDVPARRFVAWQGGAWAWADARHARFDACDPRVYLDPGRPVFRPGETVHLRGHARGCPGGPSGREGPLAGVAVRLYDTDHDPEDTDNPHEPVAEVRTDAHGDFVAEFEARTTTLRAALLGRSHVRTVVLDGRRLPQRSLRISLDRAYAVPGETVHVRAHDDAGGWTRPVSVTFTLGDQRVQASAGPGRSAEASFVIGPTDEALSRTVITATLSEGHALTLAQTDLWVGRTHRVLQMVPAGSVGAAEGTTGVNLRAEDLGGVAQAESVAVAVFGSDGNRPVGPARWTTTAQTLTTGDTTVAVRTPGAGPWWVTARSLRVPGATASTVLWDRPRSPDLGARGVLGLRTTTEHAVAGRGLGVELQRPAGGATWVSLEQSGVWASAWVAADESPVGRAWRTALAVPVEAQGGATVVATHLRGGALTTATAALRVDAAPPVELRVSTPRRVFATGASMRVTVAAQSPDASPRDGVISLWMADAGYWDMAEDTHPAPDAILGLPGRPASAGDSTHPRAWGSDEGRLLDPVARFNDEPLPELSPFDLWTSGAELVSLRATGGLPALARALALRVGLRGAVVCPAQADVHARATLEARDVPWDLLAARLADRTETHAWVQGEVLQLSCGPGPVSSSGGLMGHGSGSGSGFGSGSGGHPRAQELRGDLFFLGTRRLGPTGRTEVDIPLPAHPGRWRVQAMVIADDGRGDRAHAVVTTTRTMEARVELPPRLRVGDRVEAAVSVRAPSEAGNTVTLAVRSEGLHDLGTVPTRVTLDAQGEGRVAWNVQAASPGDARVTVDVQGRASSDAVVARCSVRDDATEMPLAVRWTLGESAADLDLTIPPLTAPGTLTVRVDADLAEALDEALDTLATPHWRPLVVRVARLAAMQSLAAPVARLDPTPRARIQRRLEALLAAETAALTAEMAPPGAPPWWERAPQGVGLTAAALEALGPTATRHPRWRGAWATLLRTAGQPQGDTALAVAQTLAARTEPQSRAAVQGVLDRVAPDAGVSLTGLRAGLVAARRVGDAAGVQRWRTALRARVEATLGAPPEGACLGWWWVCMGREGPQGALARAVLVLDDAGVDLRARAIVWLARYPADPWPTPWNLREADVADVVALYARGLSGPDRPFSLNASLDGSPLGRSDAGLPLRVTVPATGGRLRVSTGAVPGRVARVRVDGVLGLAPLSASAGTVGLVRTITDGPSGPGLGLQWTLPRAATGVTLTVPLPTGVAVARPGGSLRVRTDPGAPLGWSLPDPSPQTRDVQVVALDDGAVTLRMHQLGAGPHRVDLPLVRVAAGSFGAGGARLVSDDPEQWGVTAPVRVEYPPRP